LGRDIKEGKRSFLAIHCLSKCNEEEKTKFLEILNKKPEDTTKEDVDYVRSLYENYGSIKYAKEKSEFLIKQSKETIKDFPKELKSILEEFADYLVQRDK